MELQVTYVWDLDPLGDWIRLQSLYKAHGLTQCIPLGLRTAVDSMHSTPTSRGD